MPQAKSNYIGTLASIITIIVGLITLWVSLQTHINETAAIQTSNIARIVARDLRTRVIMLDAEIRWHREQHIPQPPYLQTHKSLLEQTITDLYVWDDSK